MTRSKRARWLAGPLAAMVLTGGALVLAAAPAGAVEVSTEAELRDAFDDEAQVDLLNDITLVDCSVNAGAVSRTVATPVVLDGHGFTITQTCPATILDMDNAFQGDLTVRDITLTGGRERDDGGAIDMEDGDLTVLRSTLTGNCAQDSAGAIENEDGDTTIIESTLDDNFAVRLAGAVRSKRGNTVLVNSTVTGNRQALNGAVDSGQEDDFTASLTLVYSDIVANSVDESLNCLVDVVEAAPADDEVGAQQDSAVANVFAHDDFASFATVVTDPGGVPNCDVLSPGSLGYNYSDDDTCGFTDPTDTENGADPQLGALASNGGPTQTLLPAPTSPLVDRVPLAACAGPDGDVTTDQRGVPRPQGPGCEIGSVELEVVAPAPLVIEPTFTG